MLTLIISFAAAVILALTCIRCWEISVVWSICWGILLMLIIQLGIGLLIRRKVLGVTGVIQNLLTEGSKKLNRKVQNLQQKAGGNIKFLQKSVEKDQNELLQKAIDETNRLNPYCKWNIMLRRQIDTMQMQFYFQIGDFEKVDKLMPNAMIMDPGTLAIKLVRMYKNNDPRLTKTFEAKVRKFKGAKSTMLYALYSWILVQRGDVDAAIKLLSRAKDITENEVILQNWQNLANGKIKKFSNAGLGEEWFALRLEEPKYNIKHAQYRTY